MSKYRAVRRWRAQTAWTRGWIVGWLVGVVAGMEIAVLIIYRVAAP